MQSDAEKVAAQLAANAALIEKSVKLKETRMASGRLLRTTAAIRRRLTRAILQDFISKYLPEDSAMRPVLLAVLEQVTASRGQWHCTWHRNDAQVVSRTQLALGATRTICGLSCGGCMVLDFSY